MNTQQESGNVPQFMEHDGGCAIYNPWWCSGECDCGAEAQNLYADGWHAGYEAGRRGQ